MVEKLVATRAKIFLFPPKRCFNENSDTISSSFTRAIIEAREAKLVPSNETITWEFEEK